MAVVAALVEDGRTLQLQTVETLRHSERMCLLTLCQKKKGVSVTTMKVKVPFTIIVIAT